MPNALFCNQAKPNYTYTCQWNRLSSVLIMACLVSSHYRNQCRLIVIWLNPFEQLSMKLESKYDYFYSRKRIWKCCLQSISLWLCVTFHRVLIADILGNRLEVAGQMGADRLINVTNQDLTKVRDFLFMMPWYVNAHAGLCWLSLGQ